jgi:Icc protein
VKKEGRVIMSGICQRSLNRRQFLRDGLALAAGVAAFGPRMALGDECKEDTRWAFLSDTHIAGDPENHYRGFYPYRNLQEIAWQIADNLPEGLVVTGDLARIKGRCEAYANVRTLLSPIAEQRPVYLGLGNHDDREDFFRAFADSNGDCETVENKHIIVTNAGPVRLIVLDTLYHVNTNPGLLGLSQLNWLATFLQVCDDQPTVLFVHHVPEADLLDTRRLFDIIGPTAKVKAVVFGHSHRFRFSQHQGIHMINLPATGYNLSGNHPVGWVEARRG